MQRSLSKLRAEGYRCYIVEFHSHGYKHDLFGFADILCLREDEILVVQTTSRPNILARVHKITESDELPYVRKAGIGIVVHGWGYLRRSKSWDCKEIWLS